MSVDQWKESQVWDWNTDVGGFVHFDEQADQWKESQVWDWNRTEVGLTGTSWNQISEKNLKCEIETNPLYQDNAFVN